MISTQFSSQNHLKCFIKFEIFLLLFAYSRSVFFCSFSRVALFAKLERMIHKLDHETKVKCPADKFFSMFKNNILDVPKAVPGSFKSVIVLKGDGKTVGTIRLWSYVLGDDPTKVYTAKEQLEVLDDENRRITFRILEGDIMEDYKSLTKTLLVTPSADGGSLVKWVVEFEKKHDHSPHPHAHVDLFALITTQFDALLHKTEAE